MRVAPALIVAAALFGLSWSAHAQVPQGSYLRSCTDIRMEGRTLTAVCRRPDGREQRAALGEVDRCVGDIANNDGVLRCNRGPTPGGPPPENQPPPPRNGEGQEYREHCEQLEHRLHDVHEEREGCPHR